MTPKEKAKELLALFIPPTLVDFSTENFEKTRQCALICVDEILEATKKRKPKIKPNTIEFYWEYSGYWLDVKQEIEKL